MTLARSEAEHDALLRALTALTMHGWPVVVTDGGSRPAFVEAVQQLPGLELHRTVPGAGLVAQVRRSLQAALAHGTSSLLYTEPDKIEFFATGLADFLRHAGVATPETAEGRGPGREGGDGVVLAARDQAGMATFPAFQQDTEGVINRSCAELTGIPGDYCYGPFLCAPALVPDILSVPDDLGWGWRPFTFLLAHRRGLGLRLVPAPHACPPDQRIDDHHERVHRMRQLEQNMRGLLLADRWPARPGPQPPPA